MIWKSLFKEIEKWKLWKVCQKYFISIIKMNNKFGNSCLLTWDNRTYHQNLKYNYKIFLSLRFHNFWISLMNFFFFFNEYLIPPTDSSINIRLYITNTLSKYEIICKMTSLTIFLRACQWKAYLKNFRFMIIYPRCQPYEKQM